LNLHAKLMEREAAGRPVRVGLVGAGKFGTMFLAQVRRTQGMHLVGLADLNVELRDLRSMIAQVIEDPQMGPRVNPDAVAVLGASTSN